MKVSLLVPLLMMAPAFAQPFDPTTEQTPAYNWLAFPYQMSAFWHTIKAEELADILAEGSNWQNPFNCEMILKDKSRSWATCFTDIEGSYWESACQENEDELVYDGLKCSSEFFVTYKEGIIIQ